MPDLLQQVLTFIPFAVAAGIAGGVVATFWPPEQQLRAYIQHFAAGLLTAIIAVDLFPEIRGSGDAGLVIASFAAGSLFMLVLKKVSDRFEEGSDRTSLGLVAAAAVDTVVDGMIIGVGFAVGEGLGLLLTVALGVELCALTLSVVSELRKAGVARAWTLAVSAGISSMLLVGASLGAFLFGGLSDGAMAAVLAFSAAALLYLATEELLLKAHREAKTSGRAVFSFFAGFILLLAFTLLGPG